MREELDLAAVHATGAELAADITALLRAPLELEYENAYVNFCIFSKKRYAALKYAAGETREGKFASKGLSIVRRDVCEFVKATCKGMLERVVLERDVDGAVAFARARADALLGGQVALEELRLSKKLGASYATDKQAHLRIRDLKISRGVAPPAVGDRVDFVYIDDLCEKEAYKRVDYIEHLRENPNIRVDYVYYYNHALRNPLLEIVRLIRPDAEAMFPPHAVPRRILPGQTMLNRYFKPTRRQLEEPAFRSE